jgi:transcriptional regulator with XRE-family HTH domain
VSARAAFGQRLRRERERRGLTLDELAAQSKVSASHFAALERGDLSRWPAGIFGIGFIRSYAQAVGLDPVKTVEEFTRVRAGQEARTSATPATAVDAVPPSTPPDAPRPVLGTDPSSGTLRLALESDAVAGLAPPPRSPQRRIAVAAAEAAVLAALAGAVWWFRGASAFWMTLAIGALVSHLVTAAAGRSWLAALLPRRSTPSRIETPQPVSARDKRRTPDTRPTPAYRRARRADRRRSQA